MVTPIATQKDIIYPDSDGKPMADNTKQFRCIVTIQGGLDALFQNGRLFKNDNAPNRQNSDRVC